jgi:2,4-dienoyl-CoA reductase (NADPH2)
VVNSIKEVRPDGTVVYKEGQVEETICGMDSIVLAMGARPVDTLSASIKGKVPEIYVVGDAKEPRKALEAIAEGADIARRI